MSFLANITFRTAPFFVLSVYLGLPQTTHAAEPGAPQTDLIRKGDHSTKAHTLQFDSSRNGVPVQPVIDGRFRRRRNYRPYRRYRYRYHPESRFRYYRRYRPFNRFRRYRNYGYGFPYASRHRSYYFRNPQYGYRTQHSRPYFFNYEYRPRRN